MSKGQHIKEHIALGFKGLGKNTITVGTGGQFADINDALTYLETVTGMTEVSGSTGTVQITENDDTVTGTGTNFTSIVQAGDLITISGDGKPPFVAAGIHFPIYGNVISDTTLEIGTGFAGTTGSGKTYGIWRPEKYSLFLMPGFHQITSQCNLPNGIALSIVGSGESVTFLDGAVTASVNIKTPLAGMIDIRDLTLARSVAGATNIFAHDLALGVSFINFKMRNVSVSDFAAAAGNVLTIRACSVDISNVSGTVYAGLMNIETDELILKNTTLQEYAGGADAITVGDAGKAFGLNFSGTKKMTIDGITIDREVALITGAGAMLEVSDLVANRIVDLSNLVLRDHDQQADVDPNCLFLSGGGTGKFNVRNSIIQQTNGAAGNTQGGIHADTAGDIVYLMGVRGDSGAVVTTDGAATFTTVY